MRRTAAALGALLTLSACSLMNQVMAPSPITSLRIATYNIRHGQGMDNAINLERTATVLRQHQPDIIGLQEVDDRVTRSGRVDQAEALGSLMDLEHAFGSFMNYQGGRYGMAILSRHPIRRVHTIALPEGEEPRIALAAEIELPNKARIMAINVHFDWVDNDAARYRQASALAAVLDTLSLPYVLLGDFNDERGSRTLRLFQSRAMELEKRGDNRDTFSSTNPVKEIDHIFVAPQAQWTVRSIDVVAETRASDHRPVVAVVEHRKP